MTAAAIRTCVFFSAGDRAHVSSTPPPTISVHGWWVNGDCPKGTKAVVTTQLQKRNVLGLWVDVGSRGVKTVYAGGGPANRSNSRYACSGTQAHQFRSWIDVDIVGFADDPTKLYTAERTLNCN